MKKIICSLILTIFAATFLLSACTVIKLPEPTKYAGPYSEVNGTFAGTDALGRVLPENTAKADDGRTVGLFYFLWLGTDVNGKPSSDYGPYDNSVTMEKFREKYPEGTYLSEKIWTELGGGGLGQQAYWGKPLFDYYTSTDEWVYRKHCQMLTDAGVDYIVFDTTNGQVFTESMYKLIDVWYEFLEAGVDVPRLAFYTNAGGSEAIYNIYTAYYKNDLLNQKYPRLDELWFKWPYDGSNKPLIIGHRELDPSAKPQVKALWNEMTDYFAMRQSQWPNDLFGFDGLYGFPWMEFNRLYTWSSVFGKRGERVINVSVAQHYPSVCFSKSWYYDPDEVNRTRGFDIYGFEDYGADGFNRKEEDAVLYGYNFADQWDHALYYGEMINSVFITGFNEWVAYRQNVKQAHISGIDIAYVDCADMNNSRDIEPMEGGYGDNYYMQMIDGIRRYKGTEPRVYIGDETKIDISGSFSQWTSEKITARYTDYLNDTAPRNAKGFGQGVILKDDSGRNDFTEIKTCRDKENLYFYVKTAENIVFDGNKPLSLFLDTSRLSSSFGGYEYVIDILSADKALLKKVSGSSLSAVSEIAFKLEGNQLMLSVPRASVGMAEGLIDLRFKWADNCSVSEDGSVTDFYKYGDAAPYGRLNYVYSEADYEKK